jgi:hypothetical protein
MIERVGHVRAFAAFASIVSTSVIGYALYVYLTLWTVIRADTWHVYSRVDHGGGKLA